MNLNGFAIVLSLGLYFIKHHNREAYPASMLLAFASSPLLSSPTSWTTRCTTTRFAQAGPVAHAAPVAGLSDDVQP
jgi:hypothetical protein